MVKADPTRNYYADLCVPATANDHDIRKAFRALALQYHPDRNPGREADVVVRFQEIQAANEVLSDPTQRAKYDLDRRSLRRHQPAPPPPTTPTTSRGRPPPRTAYTTPSGSYYRPPPSKPAPQAARPPPPKQTPTYTAGADRFANKTFRPPPTATRPTPGADARANVFTAWQKMKMPRAEEPRQPPSPDGPRSATPKKPTSFNPNGTPFGCNQNKRMPSSKAGFDPSAPGVDEGQARSVYRNHARPAPRPPSPTPPSPTPPLDHPLPTRDTQAADAPYAEANRLRTPYASGRSGERVSMFSGASRSANVHNLPSNSRHPFSHNTGVISNRGRRGQRKSSRENSTKAIPSLYTDSSEDDDESVDESNSPPATQSPVAWNHRGLSTPGQDRQTNSTVENNYNKSTSRSEENINIKFSPSDWHGKFQGSTDYFTPNLRKASNIKEGTSSRRGWRGQRLGTDHPIVSHDFTGPSCSSPNPKPLSQPQPYPMPPPPPGPPPHANFPARATFSQQDWAHTFQDPHWIFTDKKETSPRRVTEAKPRSKIGRKPSVPQHGPETQEQLDASRPKYQAFAEDTQGRETDAMDIDPPAVSNLANTVPPPAPFLPKANIVAANASLSNDSAGVASSTAQIKHAQGGLEGIGDLAKPLLAQQKGSIGLEEIGHALPFESQPSTSHPTKSNTTQQLRYPDVPFAPPPPPKIEQHTVDEYFSRMESYVKAYKRYSKTLMDHFNARGLELEELDDRFIHHRGETTKKLGFASYLTRMKEDEVVMQTWQVAQEKHIQALQQCEIVRNKAIKMYQTVQA